MSLINTPESFWQKVDKGLSCWEWTGCKEKEGYGRLSVEAKMWLAHRYAYTISKGPIPAGMLCLHHCDNPPCCKPWHLFLGTDQDNADDKMNRGRYRTLNGEDHPRSKLLQKDVNKIRKLRNKDPKFYTHKVLARLFSISESNIHPILYNKTWSV